MSEPRVRTNVREGAVLVMGLNRPAVHNAFDRRQAEELAEALDRFEAEPELRVGVVTGTGGSFCSGSDFAAMQAGESLAVDPRGEYGILAQPPAKPLIAAVEGYAVGGGCELALACDLIVASETARFGVPEVRWGLFASEGGLVSLARRIPYHAAMELALTGEPIGAEHARAIGLVNRVVGPGEALEAAVGLALKIAANAPLAVLATKEIVRHAQAWSDEQAAARQRELLEEILASEDAREGMVAFGEKRAPRWRGT